VKAARLFSLFMTLSSVAPIAAPVLGGVLLAATGSWRPMFWLLAAISLLLAAATWRAIPETLPTERRHAGGLRRTGRAFVDLARDRVFAGYALTVAFAYASLFGYISGSLFALQEVYDLSATQFSLVFAFNAAGMIGLGLLDARLVRRFPVRSLLLIGLVASTIAAVILFGLVAGTKLGLLAVLPPLFLVVASRGLVSANATVRHAWIVRRLLYRAMLFIPAASAVWALLPVVAARSLDLGSAGYGLLLGMVGHGAVAGALVIPRLRARVGSARLVTGAMFVTAAATSLVATLGNAVLVGIALLPIGGAWIAVMSSLNSGLQLALPNWVRARGLAYYLVVFQDG